MTPFGTDFFQFLDSLKSTSRLRLAPTPSGYLHSGNVFNFLLNWLAARLQPGARLLLRIDDLDADRKRPEYVQDVFDTLHWLGLDWDEGPRDAADFEKNWSQQHRIPEYLKLLDELREDGHLFACAKSRRDLTPFQGKYPLEFRNQNLGFDISDVAWRIRTPRPASDLPEDFVVRRRDGLPAYQIASVSDDLKFGITHVIRGMDLEESTAAQQFLGDCLGRDQFLNIKFLHHPLLTDSSGLKLSKSAGADAVNQIRAANSDARVLFQSFANWLESPSDGLHSANDLLEMFRKIKINRAKIGH